MEGMLKRSEEYKKLENQVRARAADEPSPYIKATYENLARCYRTLSEQTEHSSEPLVAGV